MLLLAILDEHGDSFDKHIDELGRIVDHLRQVGLRGFIAEHTGDEDFTYIKGHNPAVEPEADETTSGKTNQHRTSAGETG